MKHRGFKAPLPALYLEMARSNRQSPKICPVCGEQVAARSLACPGCGADHNSGWRIDADVGDGLDLPEDHFDYDEFVRREFGSPARPRGLKRIWWITAIMLLALSIALYILRA